MSVVVITGASRGLGLASATHLYERGWRVVGAMRSPDVGLERLRAATGAGAETSLTDTAPCARNAECTGSFADFPEGPASIADMTMHPKLWPIKWNRTWRPDFFAASCSAARSA